MPTHFSTAPAHDGLWAITGLAAAVLAWRTFHPLIILACGGLISVAVGQLT